jgi:hypothetical protein
MSARRAIWLALSFDSGVSGASGCSGQERANARDDREGGMAGELGTGAGGEGTRDSRAGGAGGSAGSANPQMCHLDCVTRRYCENGIVFRVSRGASAQFPCGTPPPSLTCSAHAFEYCDYGCATNGAECADSTGFESGGAGGQGGEAGRAGANAGGD